MNIIEEAVYRGKHRANAERHLWGDFNKDVKGKKLYLFGTASACDFFMEKYAKKYRIEGFLDNDIKKIGSGYPYQDKRIEAPEVLEKYANDEVVILILNTNYFVQIEEQLAAMGKQHYYVLCKMEAQKLRYMVYSFIGKRILYLQNHFYFFMKLEKNNFGQLLCYRKYSKMPIIKNKILFYSKGYFRDHGKYISLKLLEKSEKYDIVWAIKRNQENIPKGFRTVYIDDIERFSYEMATSHIWFADSILPIYWRKRRQQILFFTKHWSSITLKKFFLDSPIYFDSYPWQKKQVVKFGKMIDYIIVGGEFDKKTCISGLNYKNKFLCFGSPRTDILFSNFPYGDLIREKYHIAKGTKLLLFAPTFRLIKTEGKIISSFQQQQPDFNLLLSALKERFGKEWTILLRLHPSVSHLSGKIKAPEQVIDVSRHEDAQELLAACDIVISDFSSLIFEPAMTGKPVFLYVPDDKEYREEERELWFELSELPFHCAKTDEELKENILSFDAAAYQKEISSFFQKYSVRESGHACERTADFLESIIG